MHWKSAMNYTNIKHNGCICIYNNDKVWSDLIKVGANIYVVRKHWTENFRITIERKASGVFILSLK